MQAAEAGDAEKVNKARKRKKRKAEEEQLFASDNEDVAYEEGNAAQRSGAEEPEWDDEIDDQQQGGRADALKGTGELVNHGQAVCKCERMQEAIVSSFFVHADVVACSAGIAFGALGPMDRCCAFALGMPADLNVDMSLRLGISAFRS